jgi:hypothetical protein
MSRVVVGGSAAEAGLPGDWAGANQSIDVGNFMTDDEGVATLDFITVGLSLFPVQPPATTIDFVATGIATAVAHEAGHIFGCWHTEPLPADLLAGTPNLMNHDVTGALIASFGPDGVFGNADDGQIQLGAGQFWQYVFSGRNDTLNTVAFGLSTGRGADDLARIGISEAPTSGETASQTICSPPLPSRPPTIRQ